MTRQYIPYLVTGPDSRHYNPGLRPMTHEQALEFRSRMAYPARWGIEEVTPDTPAKLRAYAAKRGMQLDPVWAENTEAIEA